MHYPTFRSWEFLTLLIIQNDLENNEIHLLVDRKHIIRTAQLYLYTKDAFRHTKTRSRLKLMSRIFDRTDTDIAISIGQTERAYEIQVNI